MLEVLCVVLGIGLLFGTMAPQDLSVKVPTVKKAVHEAKPQANPFCALTGAAARDVASTIPVRGGGPRSIPAAAVAFALSV